MNPTFTQHYSPELFQAILANSTTNIYAARAIRHTTGDVVDFQIYFANPAFLDRVQLSEADVQTRTLGTLFPTLKQTGFLEVYARVAETGEPFAGEQEYPGPHGHFWYQTSVSRFNDGIVVNFTDITPHKQVSQQAQAAADMIETIVDNVPLAISLLRPERQDGPDSPVVDFVYERTNRTAARLRNLPVEAMEGQRHSVLFPEAVAAGGMANLVAVLERNEVDQYDIDWQADGMNGWFEVRTVPIDGKLMIITQDITQQRHTQLELLQVNTTLQAVVDTVQTGINLFAPLYDETGTLVDFRYELVNNTVAAYVGERPAALIGGRCSNWFPTYYDNGNFAVYKRVYETGQPERFTQHYVGDEQNVWIDVTVDRLGDSLLVAFLDISAVKHAQVVAQQQADQLQTILDASINSILAMTAIRNEGGEIIDFRMDKANQAVERDLGRQPHELEGRTLLEVYPGNVESGFFELYAKAADTGIPQKGTFLYTDVNGYTGWFEASAVRQRSDNSAPDKIVLTFMNVTESKQNEQQLQQMNDRLTRSNQSLDQFASVASHDLQEPLRKIISFGDILLEQYAPALGSGADLLRRMQSAAERMRTLVRDLLAYSRLTQNGDATLRPLDLNRVVEEVLVDLEVAIQEKNARVEVAHLPTLRADALQLRQIFQNLLSNALKFTSADRQPQIRITCEQISNEQLPADLRRPDMPTGRYWQIAVLDNGIGFSDAYRERIFGAFERLHSKSSQFGGTGIGLAIVRRVMELHHGAVTAQGVEGQGATFTLYFPVSY